MKTVLTENDLKILSERDSGGNFIYNGSVLKNVFEKINNIFIEKRGYVHEGGRGPHSSGKLLGEFGYKKKINLRPSANLFNDYEEDMVHCDWCEFLGLNAIHPLSWITEHEGRNGTCKYMTRYRNGLRPPEELNKAASSRYFETVLRLFREKHLNEAILLKDELDILCYEQHGEECFNCGSTEKLEIDHILPLYNFYAKTLLYPLSYMYKIFTIVLLLSNFIYSQVITVIDKNTILKNYTLNIFKYNILYEI